MSIRKLVVSLTLLAFLPSTLGACGSSVGQNAASTQLKTPELPTDTQTKCRVAKSQSEPLIVEWPDASRGRLESLSRRGLVAVKYEGCDLQILARCTVKANGYGYSPVTRKQSKVTIHDADDLYANMPVGAVRLESKLRSAGQLNVAMTIVGRYESPAPRIYRDDLEGECSEATHVVAALTVGSFTFFAGADAELGGGASVAGLGGAAKSTAMRETLQRDGDEAACTKASVADRAPPEGCGALLQIEVMPLAMGSKSVATSTAVAPVALGPPAAGAEATAPNATKRTASLEKSDPVPPETPPRAQPECPPGTLARNGACVVASAPAPAPRDSAAGGLSALDANARSSPPPPFGQGERGTRTEMPNPLRTTLLYTAVGMGLIGISSGYVALGAAKDAKALCNDSTRTCAPDYDEKSKQASTYGLVADVALGIAALSVIGVILLPAKVKAGVAPTPGGGMATAGGRF